MQSDTVKFGIAYWHADHQVPGVLACPLHRTTLLSATDKVSGQNRFGWVLPAQARLEDVLKQNQPQGNEWRLAEAALSMWRLPPAFTFAQHRLISLYKAMLRERGFYFATTSRVDHKRFEHSLSSVLLATSMSAHWPWLASTDNVSTFARRLLRMIHPTSPRFSRHPLNHLPLIVLLFGSWKDFWSAYHERDQDSPVADMQNSTLVETTNFDSRAASRIALVENIRFGHSVSHAAELSGVAVGTAMAWAAKEGIHNPSRPKILKPKIRSILIEQLLLGVDKPVAASLVDVSVSTVTRVLMTVPGLHDVWSASRFARAQTRARDAWMTTQQAFPEASSNAWRALDPAAYAWLYRNDRAWLQTTIRDRPLPPKTNMQRRDWRVRDASLAQAVRVAGLNLHAQHPGKRPTIGGLCAAVDGLREKFSALPKLPLTRRALQDTCSACPSIPVAPQLDGQAAHQD